MHPRILEFPAKHERNCIVLKKCLMNLFLYKVYTLNIYLLYINSTVLTLYLMPKRAV